MYQLENLYQDLDTSCFKMILINVLLVFLSRVVFEGRVGGPQNIEGGGRLLNVVFKGMVDGPPSGRVGSISTVELS